MNTIYGLALTFTPGIGSVTARKLIDRFGDIESIFAASPEELASIPRISISTAQELLSTPLEQLEAETLRQAAGELDTQVAIMLDSASATAERLKPAAGDDEDAQGA